MGLSQCGQFSGESDSNPSNLGAAALQLDSAAPSIAPSCSPPFLRRRTAPVPVWKRTMPRRRHRGTSAGVSEMDALHHHWEILFPSESFVLGSELNSNRSIHHEEGGLVFPGALRGTGPATASWDRIRTELLLLLCSLQDPPNRVACRWAR